MLQLSYFICGIGIDGARALANLLRGDGLPALNKLSLDCNRIQDEGVVALANALCVAPRTLRKELNLRNVGMGDVGMATLASVIHQGRMGQPGLCRLRLSLGQY